MQDRYIGSDTNVNRIASAGNQAVAAPAQAAASISQATAQTTNTIIQGQAQLQQIEMQRLQAEVARAQKPSGFAALAAVGADAFNQDQKRRADNKLQQQRQAQAEAQAAAKAAKENERLRKEKQEKVQEAEFTLANDLIRSKEQEYIKDNWTKGEDNFKSDAVNIIAKRNLSPKQANELIKYVNDSIKSRLSKESEQLRQSAKEIGNQRFSTLTKKLKLQLSTPLVTLAKLGVHEQSTDYIKTKIQPVIDSFIETNGKNLSDLELAKLEGVVYEMIAPSLNEKSTAYAEYKDRELDRQEWVKGHNELTVKLNSNQITESQYRDELEQLTNRTGRDMRSNFISPQEARELQIKQTNALRSMYALEEVIRERELKNVPALPPSSTQTIALGILTDPSFEINLKNNPEWGKIPAVKTAQDLVKRYREFETAQAEQKVIDAETITKIQRLNLTDVNNFVSLTRQIINKTSQGQELNPIQKAAELMLIQASEADSSIADTIRAMAQNPSRQLTAADLQQLQQTLQNQRQAINQIQSSYINENEAKRQKLATEFEDVIKVFGFGASREDLYKLFQQRLPALEQGITERRNAVNQRVRSTIEQQTQPYGQQPNFTSVGGNMVGSRQQDGSYKVTPKTGVQIQKNRGQPFITPVQTGINRFHSFNTGYMGGGYRAGRARGRKHAGIDFPLFAGQKAMTLVSGKVISIKRNPGGYGNYVDFLGDNGFVYRYAHSRPNVKVGQRLPPAYGIATSDGSGAGAPHLHFEVIPYENYKKSRYGFGTTIDPIPHLRELTKLAGQTIGGNKNELRGQPETTRDTKGWMKTDRSGIFTSGGGAISANLFQQVGKPTVQANKVFNNQRPMSNTSGLRSFEAGEPEYNYESNFGFTYLEERPELRKAIVDAAKELKVPPEWIVDIAAQESGAFRMARKVHPGSPNQNYGLFGFGSDSGVKNWRNLDEVQQVKAYVNYMKTNGWMKHKARVGGNSNIAQFWAMTRMGWNWRQQALKGRIHFNFGDTGKTYLDELRLLGNHVGREYNLPGGSRSGRSRRSSAIRENPNSQLQQHLTDNNTYIPSREA